MHKSKREDLDAPGLKRGGSIETESLVTLTAKKEECRYVSVKKKYRLFILFLLGVGFLIFCLKRREIVKGFVLTYLDDSSVDFTIEELDPFELSLKKISFQGSQIESVQVVWELPGAIFSDPVSLEIQSSRLDVEAFGVFEGDEATSGKTPSLCSKLKNMQIEVQIEDLRLPRIPEISDVHVIHKKGEDKVSWRMVHSNRHLIGGSFDCVVGSLSLSGKQLAIDSQPKVEFYDFVVEIESPSLKFETGRGRGKVSRVLLRDEENYLNTRDIEIEFEYDGKKVNSEIEITFDKKQGYGRAQVELDILEWRYVLNSEFSFKNFDKERISENFPVLAKYIKMLNGNLKIQSTGNIDPFESEWGVEVSKGRVLSSYGDFQDIVWKHRFQIPGF